MVNSFSSKITQKEYYFFLWIVIWRTINISNINLPNAAWNVEVKYFYGFVRIRFLIYRFKNIVEVFSKKLPSVKGYKMVTNIFYK